MGGGVTEIAGWAYGLLALAPAIMQVGLAWCAPWGHLTLGGQYPGVLPPGLRIGALVQSLILLLMAASVTQRAGVLDAGLPDWSIWPALAITVLTTIGNLATPSIPERRLWGPVTVAMLAAILVVIFA